MGNDPNYRHFAISQPALRVYDANSSTKLRDIVFKQEENDIAASNWHWEPEFDCQPFRADDGTITEFPLGVRLQAEVAFRVYAPEFTTEHGQGEAVSFTERDWNYLLKAQQLLYSIYFYPRGEWAAALGADTRFKVRLLYCRPSQPDGKTFKAEWTLGVEGIYTTTNPLDEY